MSENNAPELSEKQIAAAVAAWRALDEMSVTVPPTPGEIRKVKAIVAAVHRACAYGGEG